MVYRSLWGSLKKPLATGLFVLICVIDVGLHYFCSTSIVVISTHADRHNVDMSITVCLFVCLFVNLSLCIRLRISPLGIKLAASNFARWFMGVLGMESPILRTFIAPPEAQNPTNRRPFWKICSFQKKAPYQMGGCPDTLDTPWIRPWVLELPWGQGIPHCSCGPPCLLLLPSHARTSSRPSWRLMCMNDEVQLQCRTWWLSIQFKLVQ